jgi:hypothetical protein
MRRSIHCFGLMLILITPARAAEQDKPGVPITDAESVFAIYKENHGFGIDGRPPHQLIFALWPDGRIIWSELKIAGGPPYRSAKIDPSRLTEAIEKIRGDGMFEDVTLLKPHFGPDSQATVILVKSKSKSLKMQSWHELYESHSDVIATEHGITPRAGRARWDILRESAKEYVFYRLGWDELRLAAAELIPGESKPTDGKLEIRKGAAFWVESPADTPKQDAGEGESKQK